MATRQKSISKLETIGDNCHVVTWSGLLNGDDGEPVEMPGSADRSIQFSGTFGAGGTIVLEGSNFASPGAGDWFLLPDQQGNAISNTAAGGKLPVLLTRWIRPRVTAGDVSTNLAARMLLRR